MARDALSTLTPPFEAAWRKFRLAIEWSDGFSLIFIFSSDIQLVTAFRERLRSVQRLRTAPLDVFRPDSPEGLVDVVLHRIANPDAKMDRLRAPWWIELAAGPRTLEWEAARSELLARLNEQRDTVRGRTPRPLIIVLPADYGSNVRELAPDLWSIRSLVLELTSDTRVAVALLSSTPMEPGDVRSGRGAADADPLVKEWRRLQRVGAVGKAGEQREVIAAGSSAAVSALRVGDYTAATEIASTVLELARRRAHEEGDSSEALLDLAEILSIQGDVAFDSGEFRVAEEAFQVSLALAQQIVEQVGETPENLRQLSRSFNNVGYVMERRGEFSAAEEAFRQALTLCQRIVEQLGETPEGMRDLSVSFNNVGRVAEWRGELAAAEAAFQESLALAQRIVKQVGETPEGLRDLSISFNNVGRVAERQGELAAAEEAVREALALRQRIVEQIGETPEGLRDLSVSFDNVGRVAQRRGELAAAEEAFRDSLTLAQRIVKQVGETPEGLRDLSISFNNVGSVAELRGDLQAAEEAFGEAQSLAQRILEQWGETPQRLRDLSVTSEWPSGGKISLRQRRRSENHWRCASGLWSR
jgi:tetratricopeptide (TPR) repeat protein